jgi:hypothetical protein
LYCSAITSYVLHLSNALGIVDSALTSGAGKKAQKADTLKLSESGIGDVDATLVYCDVMATHQELDELAADRGESGLAISLSKPFQRYAVSHSFLPDCPS